MFLIILGIILIIFLIILFSPIKVYVSYLDNKTDVVLKYLFIKKVLVGKDKKNQKSQKKTKKEKKKKSSEKTKDKFSEKNKEKKKDKLLPDSFEGKLEFIKSTASTGGRAFRRITKHIKIKDIYVDIQISDLDACDCAVKFGKTNILVYNILSYSGQFVKLKKKSINIKCVYNQPESVYRISFNVRLTPAAAIMIVVAFIFRFMVNTIKTKRKYSQQTVNTL
ncbi:MAG: hypothetical protein IJA12_07440 [Oscillospiraceae bacterium]|nr:hypothetical protein [Oscillospiraceae bacterium]